MKIEEFVEIIMSRLSNELGDGFSVSYQKILKNNSVEQDGIVVHRDGSSIAPTIYISGFFLEYLNGRELDEIIKDILRILDESNSMVESGFFNIVDTSEPEKKVFMKLVNYEKNRKMLEDCLYDRVQDLAVLYCYMISCDGGITGSVKLSSKNCGVFNLTPEKIRKVALENTIRMFPPEFESMDSFFRRTLNFPGDSEIKLFLLTTNGKQDGAVSIMYTGILERIKKTIGTDFYIIPSSIHEVIIVPGNDPDQKAALEQMVREVNSTCVPVHEILSDRIYHYTEDQFSVSASGEGVDS